MPYSLKKIAEILRSEIKGKKNNQQIIEHLLYDSRKLIFPSSSLFFAIPGDQNNGHHYIEDLYQKNVKQFVVSEPIDISPFPDASFVKVDDTITALQEVAAYHRSNHSLQVIGITGSNGKTITKEWLSQLLQAENNVVKSPKSFNSRIGVPVSVWQIDKEHEIGIFEAGISSTSEMETIEKIMKPGIGILTHIGDAHDSGFSSQLEKINEKIKLFENSKTIIFCTDYKNAKDLIREKYTDRVLLGWSFTHTKDVFLSAHLKNVDSKGSHLEVQCENQKVIFNIPFFDHASIENAIHCIVLMKYLNYDWPVIQERISRLEAVNMRLEMKEGLNSCQLVNDSYSSDLSSIKIALDFANNQKHGKSIILVISDILQSREKPAILYSKLADIIKAYPISHIYTVGKEILRLGQFLSNSKITHFDNSELLRLHIKERSFHHEMILFKGARKYSFEHIFADLSRQIHNTILEIDLNALAQNIRLYASYLNANTKIMAMVKASAYGSGSLEMARFLESRKIHYLAVAYTDEGVELRKAGIRIPIMVLNPENASFRQLIAYDLQPEIYSKEQLIAFQSEISRGEPIDIHIKIDSGMNRLGFKKDEIDELESLIQSDKIRVSTIFTHLAASEDKAEDAFTLSQIELFQTCYEKLKKSLGYAPDRHVLNSSGIIRFPQYQFEMVRIGLGMYGIDSSGMISNQLEKVHSLKARISQIKHIEKGESVGYNRTFKASKHQTIATLSIGYADGLFRLAGNSKYRVLINGQKAPIIGNVCMDMCMVDVSHIDLVKVGDEALIFGKDNPIENLAQVSKTIPYEILTAISDRVKRIYFEN